MSTVATKFKRFVSGPDGIHLPPGRYFVDTTTARWLTAFPELLKLIPKDNFQEQIPTARGGGLIMVSMLINRDTLIPRSVALSTGPFFELPGQTTLVQAHDYLYGSAARAPRGFWEWLLEEHPDTFHTAQNVAEGISDAADKVGSTMGVVITALALGLGIIVITRK